MQTDHIFPDAQKRLKVQIDVRVLDFRQYPRQSQALVISGAFLFLKNGRAKLLDMDANNFQLFDFQWDNECTNAKSYLHTTKSPKVWLYFRSPVYHLYSCIWIVSY